MPAIFIGHGNPMNALLRTPVTAEWEAMGRSFPRPRAIVSVSAHWYVRGTAVTAMASPKTIHDFGGFPDELYRVQYPAPGDRDLAAEVKELLAPIPVSLTEDWGLDHGTWSVLKHVYPGADIPVVQLSIDRTQPAAFHYALGKRLGTLRDEGVLILGSGNIVHNLHTYAWGGHPVEPYAWAIRFESQVRQLLLARNHEPLIAYPSLGQDALLSVPTPDHYLPFLYVIALQSPADEIHFPVEGIDGGSVSMLAVEVRGAKPGNER